jgi:uncharacterized protein YecT (DUF1311 family)
MLHLKLKILIVAGFLIAAPSAQAQMQRIGDTLCDIKKLQPREHQECLRKAQDDSDRKMRERIVAISGVIDKTPNVQSQQKVRWRKALEDSQGQWIRFRNAECQDLTTFETQSKQRIAEEQRTCILDYNDRRMGVLKQRYPAAATGG